MSTHHPIFSILLEISWICPFFFIYTSTTLIQFLLLIKSAVRSFPHSSPSQLPTLQHPVFHTVAKMFFETHMSYSLVLWINQWLPKEAIYYHSFAFKYTGLLFVPQTPEDISHLRFVEFAICLLCVFFSYLAFQKISSIHSSNLNSKVISSEIFPFSYI